MRVIHLAITLWYFSLVSSRTVFELFELPFEFNSNNALFHKPGVLVVLDSVLPPIGVFGEAPPGVSCKRSNLTLSASFEGTIPQWDCPTCSPSPYWSMDAPLQWIGICVSLIGTGISLRMSWHAIKQAREARQHQIASETAYFNFGRLLVQRPWREGDANQMKFLGDPYPLGEFGKVPEDYPQGWPVVMSAKNKGPEARRIVVETEDGFHAELHPFVRESDDRGHVDAGKELQIVYAYDSSRRDRREKVTLRFETVGGERVVQVFNFIHGQLKVERL